MYVESQEPEQSPREYFTSVVRWNYVVGAITLLAVGGPLAVGIPLTSKWQTVCLFLTPIVMLITRLLSGQAPASESTSWRRREVAMYLVLLALMISQTLMMMFAIGIAAEYFGVRLDGP